MEDHPHTQWCIAKNGGGYTQRAWRYPASLWSLRWVYAVKKPRRLVYAVYPRIPPNTPLPIPNPYPWGSPYPRQPWYKRDIASSWMMDWLRKQPDGAVQILVAGRAAGAEPTADHSLHQRRVLVYDSAINRLDSRQCWRRDTIRYDTIRDAILTTCARKPT